MDIINVVEDDFGIVQHPVTRQAEYVKRYTFSNFNGVSVQVISYGATITSIKVPDAKGKTDDVVLGFDNMDGYLTPNNPYFGATVGRVCNRIANGLFYLKGKEYRLAKNWNNIHHLHGGNIGFDKFNWVSRLDGQRVIMTLMNEDGFEQYPGTVIANVYFELKADNRFLVSFSATTAGTTPINLTNHSYFNLAGHATGSKEIYNHVVSLNADRYTETDFESIPTGKILEVGGTPFDLRIPQQLGPAIARFPGKGFDDNFCVTEYNAERLTFVARVVHPNSGRFLEVYSDQPGVQFYVSNYMPDPENKIYPDGKEHEKEGIMGSPILGKSGASYMKHGAFCLETQKFPDAVNHGNFASSLLYPGDVYKHEVVYKFGVV